MKKKDDLLSLNEIKLSNIYQVVYVRYSVCNAELAKIISTIYDLTNIRNENIQWSDMKNCRQDKIFL